MPKLYVDLMSQPCRAVYLLIKLNDLPVELVQLRIDKKEHQNPASLLLCPLGKLPFLVDGDDFRLSDSAAIMSYLSNKMAALLPEHWYPRSNPQQRARVDSVLHWHHSTVRMASVLFMNRVIVPRFMGKPGGKPSNVAAAAQGEKTMREALKAIETVWLSPAAGGTGSSLVEHSGGMFLGGLKEPSIADLQVACELEQLCYLDRDLHALDLAMVLADFPVVRTWMARVVAACGPHWDASNVMVHRSAAAGKEMDRKALAAAASKL